LTALLLQLLVCALVIGLAGQRLCVSGERLAALLGLSGGWIGLALLATVTSLPELAAGISAVTWVGAPNLAVGNALGACVFNLLFLAVIELLQPEPLYRRAAASHLLAAAFGVLMLGLLLLGLALGSRLPALFDIGWTSPLLLALYLLALRGLFQQERATPVVDRGEGRLGSELLRFGLAALAVLAAGFWLPGVADGLAAQLGWNRSFAGTLAMALLTTLPELAVTLAALRLGQLDMAVGNLLGSSLFNLVVIAVDDLAYRGGALLAAVSPLHAVSAAVALMMTALVMIGLILRPAGLFAHRLSWIGIALIATYLANALFVFLHGG